jgi:hypothetical protein
MSKSISSFDPQNQKILDLMYGLSNKALDEALKGWSKNKKQNDFFEAACCKRGAGVVRILASHGLYCEERVLALAVKRECWNVVKALAKVVPLLSPLYVQAYGGTLIEHPLLETLAAGQDDVARMLFDIPMRGLDQQTKAHFALHATAQNAKKSHETARSVAWLVQAGADPNVELIRRYHPLGTTLERGEIEFVMALLDAGADIAALPDAGTKVASALYRSRDTKTNDSDPGLPRISQAGWDLAFRAIYAGVSLPALVSSARPGSSLQGTTFEGFDRMTGRLHEEDVQRIQSIQQEKSLQDRTALSKNMRSGPRL